MLLLSGSRFTGGMTKGAKREGALQIRYACAHFIRLGGGRMFEEKKEQMHCKRMVDSSSPADHSPHPRCQYTSIMCNKSSKKTLLARMHLFRLNSWENTGLEHEQLLLREDKDSLLLTTFGLVFLVLEESTSRRLEA